MLRAFSWEPSKPIKEIFSKQCYVNVTDLSNAGDWDLSTQTVGTLKSTSPELQHKAKLSVMCWSLLMNDSETEDT